MSTPVSNSTPAYAFYPGGEGLSRTDNGIVSSVEGNTWNARFSNLANIPITIRMQPAVCADLFYQNRFRHSSISLNISAVSNRSTQIKILSITESFFNKAAAKGYDPQSPLICAVDKGDKVIAPMNEKCVADDFVVTFDATCSLQNSALKVVSKFPPDIKSFPECLLIDMNIVPEPTGSTSWCVTVSQRPSKILTDRKAQEQEKVQELSNQEAAHSGLFDSLDAM